MSKRKSKTWLETDKYGNVKRVSECTTLTKTQLDEIISSVEGGTSYSISELITQHGFDYDKLNSEDLIYLEDYIFTCSVCDNVYPLDDLIENGDEHICKSCNEE